MGGVALRKRTMQFQCEVTLLLLAGLGTLGTVLGTGLHTSGNALRIEGAADDVVTNAGEILDLSLIHISSHFVELPKSLQEKIIHGSN